ncbi:MAG: NAD(+) synthase [Alphaproteobacteria bacterium]|nr:NAD(+) synthase [Alphaproteobacteria bacterium]
MKKDIKLIKENLVSDLRNFCKNAGFTDVTFGLSGGMDSALVLMLAAEALGPKHVHTMMMKTKYTSQLSIDLANELAKNVGNPHKTIDIQPLVDMAEATLSFTPQNKVTLENLQSRIRGLICMTYSNDFNRMVLACGNKSEIAMGYCTLYGDTCGALAPLGDLYKTQVYEMAELYPQIPRGIITRPASAELAHGQKDTDSMPDYCILDPMLSSIEQGADSKVPESIKKRYAGAAFKRVQMPPILKIRTR